MARRTAVRLGIPGAIVGILALIALWRLGDTPRTLNTGEADAIPAAPITAVVDLLTHNAVGRHASLARVQIGNVLASGVFWVGTNDEKAVLAVLDPNATLADNVTIASGAHISVVGLVRPAPEPAEAIRDWRVDQATADAVKEHGSYLLVTEVRRAADPEP